MTKIRQNLHISQFDVIRSLRYLCFWATEPDFVQQDPFSRKGKMDPVSLLNNKNASNGNFGFDLVYFYAV